MLKSLLHDGEPVVIASKGEGYTAKAYTGENGRGSFVQFTGDADVDVDGSPNWSRDKYGQADTSLHHNGKPINSDVVPGIVLPPELIKAVGPVVLGCLAEIEFRGNVIPCVVFDVGPHFKLGEISAAAAMRAGINPDPNHGGRDVPDVIYRFYPGVAAVVDGETYELQPYKG